MTRTFTRGSMVLLALALGPIACGGAVDDRSSANGGEPPSTASRDDGSRDEASSPPSTGATPAPGVTCCPPDPKPSGSMYLGGAARDGKCARTYDFWCSERWRIEKDALGCPVWKYDVRAPAAGENAQCQASTICTPGAYVLCRCPDASEATKQCNEDGKSFGPCGPCG